MQVEKGAYMGLATFPGHENVRFVMAAKKSANYGPLTSEGSWLLLDKEAYAVISLARVPASFELRVTNEDMSSVEAGTWTAVDTAVARIAAGVDHKTSVTILGLGKTELLFEVGEKSHRLSLVVRPTTDGMLQADFERSW
jgi:hypothetical protein